MNKISHIFPSGLYAEYNIFLQYKLPSVFPIEYIVSTPKWAI